MYNCIRYTKPGTWNKPKRQKTSLPTFQNEDSNQPAHPRGLIEVFVVLMKKLCILGHPKCAQGRFWSDWANAQANLNLRWTHISEGIFWTLRLKYCFKVCFASKWNLCTIRSDCTNVGCPRKGLRKFCSDPTDAHANGRLRQAHIYEGTFSHLSTKIFDWLTFVSAPFCNLTPGCAR